MSDYLLTWHSGVEQLKRKLSLVSIVVAVMLLALTASPALGGNGNGVENAKRAQEKVNQKVLSNKDVVGTAVGLDSEGNAIVRVFTAKSGVGGIPKEQDGVKIVAQVTGPINALGRVSAPVLIPSTQSTTDRWDRPVRTAGVSITKLGSSRCSHSSTQRVWT